MGHARMAQCSSPLYTKAGHALERRRPKGVPALLCLFFFFFLYFSEQLYNVKQNRKEKLSALKTSLAPEPPIPGATPTVSGAARHPPPEFSTAGQSKPRCKSIAVAPFLLQIPNKNLIVAFFPTGENSDDLGFSLLSVGDGILSVHSQTENYFQLVKEGNVNRQRITILLVNPVDDFSGDENGDDIFGDVRNINKHKIVTVGFLMVCTYYSVYCGECLLESTFEEECLVLLENGDLMLFEVNSTCRGKVRSISMVSGSNRVVNKRMQVSLADKLGLEKEDNGNEGLHWFKCEFSWHPRILIASHRTEVFLVDLRSPEECNVCCLLKLEMLSMGRNDGFFALSRAGTDGFSFTVATRYLLLLCDVRKPLMPVLRWAHGIQNPRYMTVFRLSDLRANAEETAYKLASESGYCIMLGSFWDSEFSLFCYGPDCNGNVSVSSKISKFFNSYYAWGLPSEFSLSNLSAQLSSLNSFGGFMLIRLTSSGKLEAQHYHAAWDPEKFSEAGHKRKSIYLEDNLLYDCSNSEYDGVKKFQHLKLEFLSTYLKGKLEKYIVKRREKLEDRGEDAQKKHPIKSETNFHQEICHRLKEFGLPRVRSSLGVLTVLKDISLPSSIHEIALRSMFAALPTNLLQFAFSSYSDFEEDPENHKEPLEFLDIPDQLQVPPFPFRKPSCRSNKWSSKVQPSDALVGPILPPLFLTTLHKLFVEELKEKRELYLEESEEFSAHSQFKHQCDKVMEVVQEHILGSEAKTQDDDFVSLADDTESMSFATQKLKFSCHKPLAFLENPSSVEMWRPGSESCIFSTHVFRKSQELASDLSPEMVGKELFDLGCPVELKFDDCSTEFGPKELETFQTLKKRDLDFQRSFKPYQDYITGRDGH
ncbi:hypothetical protein DH2020_035459 [Rehmannia glutinosa]|uniref:Uncharacterized protein n=1 Tax=Rehmannia glutinosa TaxID=99300 RepID=A0ABR0V6D1_REHGL